MDTDLPPENLDLLQVEKSLEEHLEKHPNDAAVEAQLAMVLFSQGLHSAGRQHLTRALWLTPDLAYAHYAQSFYRLVDAQFVQVPFCGGAFFGGTRELRAARHDIQKALTLEPGTSEFHVRLAQIELMRGRTKPALEAIGEACRLDPMELRPILALVEILCRRRDWAGARRVIGSGLERIPNSAPLHAEAGWLFLAEGNAAEARNEFLKALRLDSEIPRAHLGLLECGRRRFAIYRGLARVRSWIESLPVLVRLLVVGGTIAAVIALLGSLSQVAKEQPQWRWLPATLFGVFMTLVLLAILGDAFFGWLAEFRPDGRWPAAAPERRTGRLQLAMLGFGIGGAALAIASRKLGREAQWSLIGLAPGLYGLWITSKIPTRRWRTVAWIYVAILLLSGIPVALLLESRILRMPQWGVLAALLLPILPLAIAQEVGARRDREARRRELKEVL